MLPDSARERPMSGSVVRVGPGKRDKDGSRKTPKVGFRVVSCAFLHKVLLRKAGYSLKALYARLIRT